MNEQNIRVRFAPSPTGYLHVGGVRTALFNWLYARNQGGKFVLRIEDTDMERSTEKALNDILDSLKWLGLDWDEGPFYQSKRLSIYQENAQKLMQDGNAYLSENEKGKAIVFRADQETIVINDIVHGKIEFDTGLIDDFVIQKSDGMPTYNYACVVDDALMNITHVIRGDDHISNTPKQIMIYKKLGFKIPKFAHVPMILGPDGTRLSKRHGATSVGEYAEQGFLHDALVNFLALLGWAPGNNEEILDLNQLIKKFSIKRITGKSAVFNIDKLTWLNGVYISKLNDKKIVDLCKPFLKKAGYLKTEKDNERLNVIVPLFKKRIRILSEIVPAVEYFFREKIDYDQDAKNLLTNKELLKQIRNKTAQIEEFDLKHIEESVRDMVNELKMTPKDLMQTVRAAVCGRTASPGMFETLHGMGKDLVLAHLDQAIELVV